RQERLRHDALRRTDAAGGPRRAPLLLLAARARSRARPPGRAHAVAAARAGRAARDRHEPPRRHLLARLITMVTRRDLFAGSLAAVAWAGVSRAFAQSANPVDLTLAEASRMIRARQLSPVEITEAYLAAIDRLEPQVNAYVTVTAERALRQARALEAELADGRWRGPLHGIPIALKDNIDTAGILTTAAGAVFADRVPDDDAEVTRRLEAGGAVLLGKLNMHEYAYGGTSSITHFGPVHNPWTLGHIPGGSSGGSAAAVAARMCAGALGTDTLASIRLPAAYCGIVGLKPTHGLASIRGIIPVSESLDHVGPM